MNEKERAALTALRDVMAEHDINEISYDGDSMKAYIGTQVKSTKIMDDCYFDQDSLTEIIEQSTDEGVSDD